ncbi:MAG: hypothetical protein V9F01_11875 [Chitinophagaceae bacterium]
MDKNIIITIICTFIVTGILAPFSRVIFEKIFAKYDPDIKKINSGIKNSLLFTAKYLLPITNLIYLYVSYKTVDKYLVFLTVFIFSVLVLNVVLDIFFKFAGKSINVYKSIFDTINAQQNAHADTAKILKSSG